VLKPSLEIKRHYGRAGAVAQKRVAWESAQFGASHGLQPVVCVFFATPPAEAGGLPLPPYFAVISVIAISPQAGLLRFNLMAG